MGIRREKPRETFELCLHFIEKRRKREVNMLVHEVMLVKFCRH